MKKTNKLVLIFVLFLLVVLLCSCGKDINFTINFEVDGEIFHTVTTKGNDTISMPSNPTKEGYTFVGWFWDKDVWDKPFTANSLLDAPLSENLTVYAKWNLAQTPTYTITFNANGGSEVTSITKEAGQTVNAPSNPTKAGYAFGGWYLDNGTFNNAYTFATMPEGNLTLFAKWTANLYSIDFYSNGGSDVASIYKKLGEEVTPPTAPTRLGFTFEGWYLDNETFQNRFTFTTMPEGGAYLIAKWSANTYSITFNSNGGSEVESIDKRMGETIDPPTPPTKENYAFEGWFTDNNTFENPYIFNLMPANNFTLYAKWNESFEYTAVTGGYSVAIGSVTASEIVIPSSYNGESVVFIAPNGFEFCDNITSVTIPDSVTSIGNYAFYQCANLTSVTLPSTLLSIGNEAFFECESLSSITLPEGLENLGRSVFNGCIDLTSIIIPGSLKNINYDAFYGCNALSSLTINEGVETIDDLAFQRCTNLSNVIIPNSVLSIGEWAFANCNITFVIIPTNVTSVSIAAFASNPLTIYVEEAMKPSEWSANWNYSDSPVVWGCTLSADNSFVVSFTKSTTNPSSLTGISNPSRYGYTFDGWYERYNFEGTKYNTIDLAPDGNLYAKWLTNAEYTMTFDSNGGSEVSPITLRGGELITKPDDPLNGDLDFDGWYTSEGILFDFVVMPEQNITLHAVWYTNGLQFMSVDGGYSVAKGSVSAIDIIIPSYYEGLPVISIAEDAFRDFYTLKSIVINEGILSISANAFWNCYDLTSITLPNGLESIGEYAFYDCESLLTLTIPDSVTEIAEGAFFWCTSITQITIPNNITNIANYLFSNSENLSSITMSAQVTSIGEYAFANTALTSYVIPSGVTVIEEGLFEDCLHLTSVTMHDNITEIKDYVFDYCEELTSFTIPNGVTSIGNWMFSNCYKLTSVIIPNSVTSIGEYAFGQCELLQSLIIPNGVTSIGANAFYDSGLTSFVIPSSVTGGLADELFNYCENLSSVTIPEGVTSIGKRTFYNCTALKSIIIPDSVTTISQEAFYYSGLTSVAISKNVTSIGIAAFFECVDMTSVSVDPLNEYYSSIDGVLFDKLGKTLVFYPAGKTQTSYVVPDGVENIYEGAFYYSQVETVILPNDVLTIGETAFGYSSLVSISLGNKLQIIGNNAFNSSNLKSIVLPASLTSINDNAFSYCYNLESVIINGSSLSIGLCVFYSCLELKSITIPHTVTSIGWYTFSGCNNLIIYTDASSSLAGWNYYWNPGNRPIVWDCNLIDNSYVNIVTKYDCYGHNTVTNNPYRADCTFGGWYEDPEFMGVKYETLASGLDGVTYYARWITDAEFSMTFDSNGEGDVDPIICHGGDTVSLPQPTKEGYAFKGWFTDNGTFDNEFEFTVMPEEDILLYAKWIKLYTVTFNGNGGTLISGDEEVIVEHGENAPTPIYEWSGYEFSWDISPDYVTSDLTITAIWFTEGLVFAGIDGGWEVMNYSATSTEILIPETFYGVPVIQIGDYAFSSFTDLISVIIPSSVLYIGESAFYGCSFTSIILPENLETIGVCAFMGCSNLSSLNLPSSVTFVGDFAFAECIALSSVNISINLSSIGMNVFGGCVALSSITVDENNSAYKSVDGNLYNKSGTEFFVYAIGKTQTEFTIPSGVTTIKEGAFYLSTKLTTITIPDGVICIERFAFSESGITSVTIPASVTDILDDAFAYCADLTTVTILAGLKNLGKDVFVSCSSLLSFVVDIANTNFSAINGDLYNYDGSTLLQFAIGKSVSSFVIPDTVTNISSSAFYDSRLQTLIIPDNVAIIGDYAFVNCGYLTIYSESDSQPTEWGGIWNSGSRPVVWGCTLSADNSYVVSFTKYSSSPENSFGLTLINPLRNGYTFAGWYESSDFSGTMYDRIELAPFGTLYSRWFTVDKYTISFNSNGGGAVGAITCFGGETITEPAAPERVGYTFLGWFYDNSTFLNEFVFDFMPEDNVTIYAKWEIKTFTVTFNGNGGTLSSGTEIQTVNYGSSAVAPEYSRLGFLYTFDKPFDYVTKNMEITAIWYTEGLAFTQLEYGYSVAVGTATAENIIIPELYQGWPVLEVGDFSVKNFIKTVVIPDSVTTISNGAFSNNQMLETVTMSANVEIIGSSAFYACYSLTSINLGNKLKSIGASAFFGSWLSIVTIYSSVETIGYGAFEQCGGLTIYAQFESKPAGWDNNWNVSNCTVVWNWMVW